MDIVERLSVLPWGFWIALGLTVGTTVLLVCSRIAESEQRYRPRRTLDMLYPKKAPSPASPTSEKRILITDRDATIPAVSGRLLECTITSVSLQVADSLERGTILSWRAKDTPENLGWAVVEVKGSIKDGRYWKIDCRFVRTPPWVTRFLEPVRSSSEA